MVATLRGCDRDDETLVIDGRYEIEARIGQGASGSVYRVHDRALDRQVALKLLEPGVLDGAEHEARSLAQVVHRNVVTIHDRGRSGGRRYLVLELLRGPSLAEWLSEAPRDSQAILAHFIEAGRGLQAAHEAGIAHRDFKAQNVILAERGRVVVVDFGLAETVAPARAVGDLRSPAPLTRGSLAYMAPELLDGAGCDARSDQFSFCVALWEALAGHNPFHGGDPASRYESIAAGPGARPRAERQGSRQPPHPLRRDWAASLSRGMHIDPARRFESMAALLAALDRPHASARSWLRPLVLGLSAAAAFCIGWGITVTAPTLDASNRTASFDVRLDAASSCLARARAHAQSGDPDQAQVQLVAARQLAATLHPEEDDGYCELGRQVPAIAQTLAEAGHADASRLAYAIALRFAEDCTELDRSALLAAREAARSTSWARTNTQTHR